MMRVWEMATGKLIRNLPIPEGEGCIWALAFSPDGKTVVTGAESKGVSLWESATGKKIRTFHGWKKGEEGVSSVAFSPDGQTVVAGGSSDDVVRLWEAATGKLIHTLKRDKWCEGHEGTRKVTFSPDGKTIVAAGGRDGVVHLWESSTGKEIRTLQAHKGGVFSIAFAPDGRIMASAGYDGMVRLWETATGKLIHRLQGHKWMVNAVTFTPDGKTVVTAAGDQTVRLWEAATGKPIRMPSGHEGAVSSVAFTPDGKTVVTAGRDQTVRLWEAATGKEIRTLQRGWQEGQVLIPSATFSPDGKTAITKRWDRGRAVHLWEVATGKEIRTLQDEERRSVVTVAFSPDGKILATDKEDGTVCLWETATGKGVCTLGLDPLGRPRKNQAWVSSIAFSRDGKTLAVGGNDGEVRLWDTVVIGKEIRTLKGYKGQERKPRFDAVSFSPDGKIVAAGGENGLVRLWEVATGEEICTLQGQNRRNGFTVAFSPDGRTLAVGCGDCIQLWDLPSGDAYPILAGHRGDILGVTFSPDGRTLASVSADTTGLVWDLTFGAVRPVAKLSPDRLPVLWNDLASEDSPRARRVVWTLAAAPDQSVPLLRDRLRPVPADAGKRLAQLVADLDADDFKLRERARRGLEELGPDVEPALRKGLESKPSLEKRRRLEQLLEGVREQKQRRRGFSGEFLRGLRAVAVLERAGTPEARQVLKTLAAGDPGFRLTQEAQAALNGLDRAKRP